MINFFVITFLSLRVCYGEETPGLQWTCHAAEVSAAVSVLTSLKDRILQNLLALHIDSNPVLDTVQTEEQAKYLWYERIWKADEEPLAVVVRSDGRRFPFLSSKAGGYEYPCEDASTNIWFNFIALPHPWGNGVVSCKKKLKGIELVASKSDKLCIGTIFRAHREPRRLRFLGERFSPIYPTRLAIGILCWYVDLASILLARCAFALALIYIAISSLQTQISIHFIFLRISDSLIFFSLLSLITSIHILFAEFRWWYRNSYDCIYDHSRGFYVQKSTDRQPKKPMSLILFRTLAYFSYKIVGFVLLVSSDPDRSTALALSAIVILGIPIALCSLNSCFQTHSHSPERRRPLISQIDPDTHRRQVAKHTRTSLDALRAHLQTTDGQQDMARLANHPFYAATRDEQIRQFIHSYSGALYPQACR
uniref:Uncharacterized protein n=1 Tax=Aureoumbra lagunensis TaxID=44058 RepID=A0A7S3K5T5_9STRA